ncbi:hypothetical protein UPYG_G00032800 [Umbra pygmaea]|uniref:Uncharacterized protein n=1 Tax=Umbra pygmaea TaxID=75934 RepID=A0ABD0Y1R3_UMBPY
MEEILYGAVKSDLIETFLQFVSVQEGEIIRQALVDYTSVDFEELVEVLDNYECRRRVTADNLPNVLIEIAHKELVQKPKYVIDCWRDVTQMHISLNGGELKEMYANLKPTPRKVVGLLHFPACMTTKQKEIEHHLKRYIREMDEEKLSRFLRFTTGSDLITCNRISALFSQMSDFTRRPIGRTCGRVLELADCYDNFPDFRAEFNAVLDSNIWVMDII